MLRQEILGVPFTALALEDSTEERIERHTTNIARTFNLISKSTSKLEPEYMDGFLGINRVSEATIVNNHTFERTNCVEKTQEFREGQPLQLNVKTPGLIGSIEFIEDRQISEPLGADEVEIEVHAAGVNLRDLLQINGKVASDVYGCERAGARVGENCTQFCAEDRIATSLTFSQAASILVAFTTAWYSLNEISSLQPGENILINSGAGGTGQVLIQFAQLLGSEVFVTVSSAKKKRHLMKMYDIREDHIFFSRDDAFADGIMTMTQGKGVDIVVNSVFGEKLAVTWECIAPFGRMIEIGWETFFSRGKLDMYSSARNTMFAAVNLDDMAAQRPLIMSNPCRKIMELIAENKLRPFNSLEVLSISDLRKVLRALQGGKHIGKMVVEFERKRKFWLLSSRNGTQGYSLRQYEISRMGALRQPQGFRIMKSTYCSAPRDSNYAAGNTYQDALAQFRLSNGEKATAIDLGVVLGAGFVTETPGVRETLQQIGSILPLDLEKLFALFDLYCDVILRFQSPIHSQVITGLGILSQIIAEGKTVPSYLYEPMFLPLHQMNALSKVSQDANEAGPNYKNILAACLTIAEAGLLVAIALRSSLSKILGIPEDDIELRNRVESYGIDSLAAVKLRSWFGREMGAGLAVFEILGAKFWQ
ncbi:putative polyketide synthase protein [Botrytis fragariae]|uniref:Putative polyketide synthase protein n=1 Tax=Botrytis fragariae TaxID=1964551 RepID=A0A8H6ELI5_9HELO|nr:putative polyketide synthase protein [Botrytis fragariae]KAF5876662.1 putative polyketide synthase protein [Botrytis fragariae]